MRDIILEDRIAVHESVFVADNATITGDVTIGENSSVWYNAVIRGDMEPIVIGKGSSVQDCCTIHVDYDYPTVVGNKVTIGHGAILHGCIVGNNVIIGIGAVLLNGVKIGDNSIIGSGSVIPEGAEIPPNSLVMGIPGKVKAQTTDLHIERIIKNADVYIGMAKAYKEKFSK